MRAVLLTLAIATCIALGLLSLGKSARESAFDDSQGPQELPSDGAAVLRGTRAGGVGTSVALLSLRLVDAITGFPIEEAELDIEQPDVGTWVSGAQGTWQLVATAGLASPSDLLVHVQARGYACARARLRVNAPPQTIELVPVLGLRLTVVGDDDEPVAGACLRLSQPPGVSISGRLIESPVAREDRTDARGLYITEVATWADTSVQVHANGYIDKSCSVRAGLGAAHIRLERGIPVCLAWDSALKGSESVRVELRHANGSTQHVRRSFSFLAYQASQSANPYLFSVREGRHVVRIWLSEKLVLERSVIAHRGGSVVLEIPSESIVLSRRTQVEVRVTTELTAESVEVRSSSDGETLISSATPGEAALIAVPAGACEVTVSAPGHETQVVAIPPPAHRLEVELRALPTARLTLQFPRDAAGATVRLAIFDAGGTPRVARDMIIDETDAATEPLPVPPGELELRGEVLGHSFRQSVLVLDSATVQIAGTGRLTVLFPQVERESRSLAVYPSPSAPESAATRPIVLPAAIREYSTDIAAGTCLVCVWNDREVRSFATEVRPFQETVLEISEATAAPRVRLSTGTPHCGSEIELTPVSFLGSPMRRPIGTDGTVSLRGVRAPALYSYQIGSSRGLVHLPTSGDVSVGTLSKDQVLVVRSEFTIRAYSRDGESLLVSMGERISTAESRVSVRGSDCVIRADTEHGRAFWVAPANASAVSFPHVRMVKATLEGRTTLVPKTRIAVRVMSLDGVEMEPLLGFKPTVGTYVQDAMVLPIAAEETVFQFRAHLKLGDLVWEQRVPDGALPARTRYVPR